MGNTRLAGSHTYTYHGRITPDKEHRVDNTLNTGLNEVINQTHQNQMKSQTREKLGHREHMGRKTHTDSP